MSEHLPAPDPSQWPADPGRWVRRLPTGTALARIYATNGPHPAQQSAFRHFGPTGSRFDHHPAPPRRHPDRGVLYAAIAGRIDEAGVPYPAIATALAEYYQNTRTIAPHATSDWLAILTLARPITLLDLGDSDWLTRAGGNAAMYAGPRADSRTWASAIHHQYPTVEGLIYPSSVAPPGRAVALWERAADAIAPRPVALPLTDPAIAAAIENASATIGYHLVWG